MSRGYAGGLPRFPTRRTFMPVVNFGKFVRYLLDLLTSIQADINALDNVVAIGDSEEIFYQLYYSIDRQVDYMMTIMQRNPAENFLSRSADDLDLYYEIIDEANEALVELRQLYERGVNEHRNVRRRMS